MQNLSNFERTANLLLEKQALVLWDDNSECYSWAKPQIKLRGITKDLKARFYPNPSRPVANKDKNHTLLKPKKKWIKGRKGGTKIHEEIEDFVEKAKKGKQKKRLDPRTLCIINEVIARNWIILEAEYCVGDRDLRRGTGIDLLCSTKNGDVCLVELKIGFDNVDYDLPTKKRMSHPFRMMHDNYYSQHQLQLLASKYLFETMVGIEARHVEVWVIGHPQGVTNACKIRCYPIHPDIAHQGKMLIMLLSDAKKKTKKRVIHIQKEPQNKKRRKTTTSTF